MLLRNVSCDIAGCASACLETAPGEGWTGWGQFYGIKLNGVDNPYLCPDHVARLADFVDSLKVTA